MTGRELVQIVFGADISGLEAQALAVGRSMDKLGHRLRTLGIVTGLVFGGIAIASSKAFAQIEYDTAQIATLMDDVSTDTIPQLRNEIMQLGVDFGQTFETMAKARYDVVSAGFRSIEESIMLMESANRLALAGAAEVGPTAKLVAQALRGYGKGAEYAAMMSDQLFQVVKFGVTTVPELTGSMGRIYSTARAAGVGVEELHAAVSILTAVTGNSNESVNALNRLLFAMAAPTSQAAEALAKAGIRVVDYEGKVLSLVKVIEQFRGKNAGQVKELIGGRINAAKALIIMAQNTEQYKEALLAMIMAQGSVTKASLLMGEQTKKTFDTMIQSANRLRVVIGETLDKDVRKTLGDITYQLNKMASAENKSTADFIWGGIALSKWALIAALTTKITKGLAIAVTQMNMTSLTLGQTWSRINWTAPLHPIRGLKNAFAGLGGSMARIGATQLPIFMSGLGLLFGGLFAIDVIVRDAYKHIGELFELRPETEDWRKLEAIVKKTAGWTEELTTLTTKYADVVTAIDESMKGMRMATLVGPGREISPKLGRKAQEEWTDLLNISGEIIDNINSTTLASKDLMRVMQESGIYSVMAVDKQVDALQNQMNFLDETKTLINAVASATGKSAEYLVELFELPNIESAKQKLQAIIDLLLQIKLDTLADVGFRGLDEANIMLRPPIEPDIEHMRALKNAVAGVATEADWLASEFVNVFETIRDGSAESAEEVIETGEKFIDLRNLAQKFGDTVDTAASNAAELFWVIEVAGQRATNVFLEQRASAERLAWAFKQTGKEHVNALQETANELLAQITYLEETNRIIKDIARMTGETPEVIAKFFDFPNIFGDLDLLNEQLREVLRIMMEIRRTERQREFKPTPGFYAHGPVGPGHPYYVPPATQQFEPADLFTSLQVLWAEMEDQSRYSSEEIRAAWSTTFTEGAGMFSDLANIASRARDDVLSAWFDVASSLLIMIDSIITAIQMKTMAGALGGIGMFIGALSVLDQARDRRRAGAGTRRYPTGSGIIPGVGAGHTVMGLLQPGEAILSREDVRSLVKSGNNPTLRIENVNVTLQSGSTAEAEAAAKQFVLTSEEEFARMFRRTKLQGRLG